MSLRFQSQLQIDMLPDEQVSNQFEVIMPTLPLYEVQKSMGDGFFAKAINTVTESMGLNTYTPIVEEISFGVKNFKTNTRRVRTGWCNVPEDIENYRDVSITMFCSAGMLTQYYLESWKNLMFNNTGEYYNPMYVYKKNIEVLFFGPGNIGALIPPVAHFTLKGCFPYSQDDFKLSYDKDPQRLRMVQRFKVDRIEVDRTLAGTSIAQELITSPTGLLDKAMTSINNKLGNGASQYSIDDVYK